MSADGLTRAAELLRSEAASLRECHTLDGNWTGEAEAKEAHDEMLAAADSVGTALSRIEALERANAVLEAKNRSSLANNLCPDHRDKQAGKPCLACRIEALERERDQLKVLINSPELHDFTRGVALEAVHQRQRWGSEHGAGKAPADWFWLVGYLAGKALHAQTSGNVEKTLHHTISTAAALANWHAAVSGADTSMRPGIETPQGELA